MIEFVLRTDVPVSHYEGGGDGTIGLTGGVSICYPVVEEIIRRAGYQNGQIYLETNLSKYETVYSLMSSVG